MRLPFLYIFFICGLMNLSAQEAVLSSGGDASGATGEVSYSVGQSVFLFHSGLNASEWQGVQQPYEISIITMIPDNDINEISVYPNPATDHVCLEILAQHDFLFDFSLYDLHGRLLEKGKLYNRTHKISLMNYSASVFYLRIQTDTGRPAIFKIVKTYAYEN